MLSSLLSPSFIIVNNIVVVITIITSHDLIITPDNTTIIKIMTPFISTFKFMA